LRLAQRGYQVVVFEKLPIPGGMMTVGIPEYRLPRGPLFSEIENIQRAGVEIRCNQALGRHFTLDHLFDRDGFKAVVLAIGAHQSRKLGIQGEDKQGVIHGTDFLRDIALTQTTTTGSDPISMFDVLPGQLAAQVKGKRVAVVGGGDVAIDAARSAWRLGANQVYVLYRRQRQDMPAHPEEIEAAEREGIQFYFLVNPSAVLGEDAVTGVVVQRQFLAEFDNSGRRRPVAIDDGAFTLDIDILIPAIGQTTQLPWKEFEDDPADWNIETTRSNTFVVKEAFNTTRAGVFAAGDAVSGPATVVQAVAQGNLVAVAVDTWLRTGEIVKPRFLTPLPDIPQIYNLDEYADAQRPVIPEISVDERLGSFREVEMGFEAGTAQEEAKRCLRCDLEWLDWMHLPRL
jgi:NADH-quinone oxidoreductase subunit F